MDFEPVEAKPAEVHFPVVDTFAVPVPIAPLSAIVFSACFAAVALLTVRRPALGLAALLAIQPFALYREAFGTDVTLPKVALLGVIAGLTAFRTPAPAWRDGPWRAAAAALVLLVALTALSALHALHPAASLRETGKFFEYAALLVTAFLAYRLDPDDQLLVGAVALSATLVALTALAQLVTGASSGLRVGSVLVPRIAGALEGPNQLAAYLESSVAMLGSWAIARSLPGTAFALALSTGVAVLSLSRAGIAALAIVAVVLFAFRGSAALRALLPMGAGALAGAAAAGVIARSLGVFRFSFDASDYAGGVGTRDQLWRAAWTLWHRHPLFGVGAGNFELELDDAGLHGVRTHANSWYLQALVEGGPLLLAATLAFVVTLGATFWRNARSGSPWILAALAATMALSIHQIVDYVFFFPKVAGAYFILLGIALSSLTSARENAATCARSS